MKSAKDVKGFVTGANIGSFVKKAKSKSVKSAASKDKMESAKSAESSNMRWGNITEASSETKKTKEVESPMPSVAKTYRSGLEFSGEHSYRDGKKSLEAKVPKVESIGEIKSQTMEIENLLKKARKK